MKFNIDEFFSKYNYGDEKKSYFSGFNIESVSLIQEKELVVFKIKNDYILPFKLYENLKEYFKKLNNYDLKEANKKVSKKFTKNTKKRVTNC